MSETTFNLEGADGLNRKLQTLGNPRLAKRIARKAGRQAMNIVRDAARTNAKAIDDPESMEKIWKNIAVQAGKSRDPNVVVTKVGVRGGASFSNRTPPRLSGGDTRHWRFKEFPTSQTTATPFMWPALSGNVQLVTAKFTQVFNAEIDLELLRR